ncbi:hypothetical protein [Sphingomonas sp. NPDC079357]|uniref:hypothetical protein n=1 Tax=Sphingomonas sp. NPDC079357 TaxID=3364518 RepID=UPI00384C0332
MSSTVPPGLCPIIVVQDRYQGACSGGAWLVIAQADRPLNDTTHVAWVLDDGPGGADVCASDFWSDAPSWVASAHPAVDAIARLVRRNSTVGAGRPFAVEEKLRSDKGFDPSAYSRQALGRRKMRGTRDARVKLVTKGDVYESPDRHLEQL